jgi:hypothetical protein
MMRVPLGLACRQVLYRLLLYSPEIPFSPLIFHALLVHDNLFIYRIIKAHVTLTTITARPDLSKYS